MKKQDVQISIIVPIYKVEKYLVRCVESLMAQDFSSLEIILIDDGSPDRCGEICDNYAKKDTRITAYHKPNGGLSDARNYGLERRRFVQRAQRKGGTLLGLQPCKIKLHAVSSFLSQGFSTPFARHVPCRLFLQPMQDVLVSFYFILVKL